VYREKGKGGGGGGVSGEKRREDSSSISWRGKKSGDKRREGGSPLLSGGRKGAIFTTEKVRLPAFRKKKGEEEGERDTSIFSSFLKKRKGEKGKECITLSVCGTLDFHRGEMPSLPWGGGERGTAVS